MQSFHEYVGYYHLLAGVSKDIFNPIPLRKSKISCLKERIKIEGFG
jgi:hypothetical protein